MQMLFDVPAGYALDKFGYLRLLKIATFIFCSAAAALIFFGLTPVAFVVTVVISSFGWLFFTPGINAYVLSHAPRKLAGTFVSFRDMAESSGVVLSSAVFVLLLPLNSRLIGLIILLILLTSFVFASVSPRDTNRGAVHEEKKISTHHYYIRRNFFWHIFKTLHRLNPASTMLLLVGLVSSIFYAIIWFVVPLMIAGAATNNFIESVGLGIFDFSVLVLGFFLGKIVDRWDKKTLVLLGLLLFSLAGIYLGFNFGILFLVLGFVSTVGEEISSISLWAWLNVLDKDHLEDGLIAGIINFFQDLGWAIGPLLAGILYGIIGPAWTIATGGFLIFAVLIFYSVVFKPYLPSLNFALADFSKKPHHSRHKR